MIRHIVFFIAKNKDDIGDILSGLRILRDIPHATRLEVEPNLHSDDLSDAVDVVVYGEFADEAALAAYKAHPLYQDSIRRVRPLRELRMAADFQSPFTK
ncbi:Dabb family protein [Profundibacter amoris]|uniref:Dabb family protein n=1 Tax=Profundibacter amoris TaxID=2171755 RepID=A0A347UDP4_9RHOB|nr:Dabb family protein [Profundibacter amoris]AXX96972.1 Dabb family protein [Profundibacter amoris]